MKSKNAAFSWVDDGAFKDVKKITYRRERMYNLHALHVDEESNLLIEREIIQYIIELSNRYAHTCYTAQQRLFKVLFLFLH